MNEWQEAAALWNRVQGPRETLNEYLEAIEKQSLRAQKVLELQIVHATLNGLKPRIRQQVLQYEPTSLVDIKRWGTIAKSSDVDTGDYTTSAVLKEFQLQLAKMQITPMTKLPTTTEIMTPMIPEIEEQQTVKTYTNTRTILVVTTTIEEIIIEVLMSVIKQKTGGHGTINPVIIMPLGQPNRSGKNR